MQIDDNLIPNTLPPLYSPTHKNKNLSSKSLIDLKEEIKKLYPRVHRIENEIESIKKQVPSNLNKIFLYLSSNIQKYSKGSQTNDNSTNEDDLSDKLKEIENRLLLEIDISMKKSSSDFDQQINILTRKNESTKDFIFNEFNDDPTSNIQYKIKKVEERFLQQEKRINSRFLSIEKTFDTYSTENFNQETFQQYTNDINLHNEQIKEIKLKLDEINELIQENKENLNEKNESNKVDPVPEQSTQKSQMKIFSRDFENVQSEIKNLTNEFDSSLATLNEYNIQLEKRMLEISSLSTFIDEKTKDLEHKAKDNDSKYQIMVKQLSEITKNIDDNQSNKKLNNLYAEFKKIHEDIQNEIENIRESIKNYEVCIQDIKDI